MRQINRPFSGCVKNVKRRWQVYIPTMPPRTLGELETWSDESDDSLLADTGTTGTGTKLLLIYCIW
jgi:hypothetical protein